MQLLVVSYNTRYLKIQHTKYRDHSRALNVVNPTKRSDKEYNNGSKNRLQNIAQPPFIVS